MYVLDLRALVISLLLPFCAVRAIFSHVLVITLLPQHCLISILQITYLLCFFMCLLFLHHRGAILNLGLMMLHIMVFDEGIELWVNWVFPSFLLSPFLFVCMPRTRSLRL